MTIFFGICAALILAISIIKSVEAAKRLSAKQTEDQVEKTAYDYMREFQEENARLEAEYLEKHRNDQHQFQVAINPDSFHTVMISGLGYERALTRLKELDRDCAPWIMDVDGVELKVSSIVSIKYIGNLNEKQ